jgi:hypothetical protein
MSWAHSICFSSLVTNESHEWRNIELGIMIAMMIVFRIIHLLATEYVRTQRAKGDLLLFQCGHAESPPIGSMA